MCEGVIGAATAQRAGGACPHVHLGDLREARSLMLEDILTVQESGTDTAVATSAATPAATALSQLKVTLLR